MFDSVIDVPLAELLGKVDYVIGNPPYVTLYGRRDRKQNEQQRIYFLRRYSQFPDTVKNGKINYVMLFIEQSVDLLKDGGRLSFIVDLAFFETAYQYTRKYLLDHTKILSIEYNIMDFDVASGQIILKVEKGRSSTNNVIITDAETQNQVEVNQSGWDKADDQYRFRFNICSRSSDIIQEIKSRGCPSLKTLYPKKNLRTCTMLLDMEHLFIFDTPNLDSGLKVYPYYQGSKSLREKYGRLLFSRYFYYNKQLQDTKNDELKGELTKQGIKNKKRLGLGETVIYDNPKIYVRQSAKEIIASYDEFPSASNNSLYVFSLRNNSHDAKMFLKYLCGVFNTELITFFAQQQNIIRYSKGKQPQIKTSDLYSVPVPTDSSLQLSIVALVENILLGKDEEQSKKRIDNLLYSYFDLTPSEISTVRTSIESF